MPSPERDHPVREAARGIALLTGLAVGAVAVAAAIATTVVLVMG